MRNSAVSSAPETRSTAAMVACDQCSHHPMSLGSSLRETSIVVLDPFLEDANQPLHITPDEFERVWAGEATAIPRR